ncbi:hypothetical protein QNI16_12420 [Cytophagaceae bacterium YF14B1]|uniref:Uncharacterized protein n=1 Tax=Xanthocytophaga flava TaxID=3048013 RepID=A0AAE3U8K9_9BACT|nr:hypothetical protein [Xanthocytophaga flavus]MDJ1481293.1 hypothetical protein [Xanthocytophaga flavus]
MKVIPLIPERVPVVSSHSISEQQQLRQTAQAAHEHTQPLLLQNLEKLSKDELIAGYRQEMSAKNKAYYFILESGLINQFYAFCFQQSDNK